MKRSKTIPFYVAVLTLLTFSGIAGYMIIALHAEPHIPMILGTALTALVAMACGSTWEEVEEGMVDGMARSLGACTILLLIGLLIGVWIIAGVVPAMICYGLRMLSAKTFLVGSLLLCALISMALGSWGTAGTIGIALISIAQILGIPLPLAAGAIVSGSYLGDRISPISDMSNLVSAVSGVGIRQNIKSALPLNLVCLALSGVFYWLAGRRYWGGGELGHQVQELTQLLQGQFRIGLWSLIPLAVLLGCILMKVPAIPSIFGGIISAAVMAVLVQGQSPVDVMSCCFYGYLSQTGNTSIDAILSTGGIDSMHFSLSLALTAMMLGGVMDSTGMIAAVMRPLLARLKRTGDIAAAVTVSTLIVNVILPDSYVAIAIPGQMFSGSCQKQGIPLQELSRPLGSGACSFSPLIPWNACGVFISVVLGVSVLEYAPYAVLNFLVPVGAVLAGYGPQNKKREKTAGEAGGPPHPAASNTL